MGIAATGDNGSIITGFTYSLGNGGSDCWILRLDRNGDTVWTKTVGGGKDERAVSIIKTSDGNYVITGETYSFGNGDRDIFLFKINDGGDILWTKSFGGTRSDRGFYTRENSKHELIVCGITENNNNGDIDSFIKCLDKDGNELWHKTYGGKGSDVFHSILVDEKDNIFLAGYKEYTSKLHYPWIIKLNSAGKVLIEKVLEIGADSRLMDFYINKNNTLIGTGYTKRSEDGDWDILLIKTDLNNNTSHAVYHTEREEQGYAIIPFENSSLIIGHSHGIRNKDGDLLILEWKF